MSKNRLNSGEPQDDGQHVPHVPAPQPRPVEKPLYLPLPLPLPKPGKVRHLCWLCDLEIENPADGRSLEDPGTYQVLQIHHRCWDKIPDADKLLIRATLRQNKNQNDAAAMWNEAREAMTALRGLLEMAVREYRHRSDEETGGGIN